MKKKYERDQDDADLSTLSVYRFFGQCPNARKRNRTQVYTLQPGSRRALEIFITNRLYSENCRIPGQRLKNLGFPWWLSRNAYYGMIQERYIPF